MRAPKIRLIPSTELSFWVILHNLRDLCAKHNVSCDILACFWPKIKCSSLGVLFTVLRARAVITNKGMVDEAGLLVHSCGVYKAVNHTSTDAVHIKLSS